jgi:hypothetical protein
MAKQFQIYTHLKQYHTHILHDQLHFKSHILFNTIHYAICHGRPPTVQPPSACTSGITAHAK